MPIVIIYSPIPVSAPYCINYALSHHSNTGGNMLPKMIQTTTLPGNWHSCEINGLPEFRKDVLTQIRYCKMPGYLVHDDNNNILFVNEINNEKYNYDWILSGSYNSFTIRSAKNNLWIKNGTSSSTAEYIAHSEMFIKGVINNIECGAEIKTFGPSYYNIEFTKDKSSANYFKI
jgi:hypothetical protein